MSASSGARPHGYPVERLRRTDRRRLRCCRAFRHARPRGALSWRRASGSSSIHAYHRSSVADAVAASTVIRARAARPRRGDRVGHEPVWNDVRGRTAARAVAATGGRSLAVVRLRPPPRRTTRVSPGRRDVARVSEAATTPRHIGPIRPASSSSKAATDARHVNGSGSTGPNQSSAACANARSPRRSAHCARYERDLSRRTPHESAVATTCRSNWSISGHTSAAGHAYTASHSRLFRALGMVIAVAGPAFDDVSEDRLGPRRVGQARSSATSQGSGALVPPAAWRRRQRQLASPTSPRRRRCSAS